MKNTELNEAFLYVDDRYLNTVNFTDKEIINFIMLRSTGRIIRAIY